MRVETRIVNRLEKYYRERGRDSVFFYPIAVYYYNKKQFDEAYKILIDGLQYFPRYALALILVGRILMDEGNYESALAYLETAAKIQKTNTEALKLLAFCYENMSIYDKAQKVYEKIVELTGDEWAKEKLLELASKVKPKDEDLGKIAEELEDKTDIPTIELEEEEQPEEEEATVTLAKLYEKQGYINDAIDTYKKILEKDPENVEAKEALERLLNDVGLGEGEENGEN